MMVFGHGRRHSGSAATTTTGVSRAVASVAQLVPYGSAALAELLGGSEKA